MCEYLVLINKNMRNYTLIYLMVFIPDDGTFWKYLIYFVGIMFISTNRNHG